jgi:hypothetical protein
MRDDQSQHDSQKMYLSKYSSARNTLIMNL